jgi:hypothetical protein
LLLAGCPRHSVTVHAEFNHWLEADGTTHWQLILTPDAWRQLGHGERLDAHHQNISPRAVKTVSALIDANLEHMHLCPREWTMADVRHFDNGYLTFAGSCDTPPGERT